ncbi:hypothetical protein G5B88_00920 [Herbaspirillum seropedicae]|uniref:Uncharacterized protein n=1 Tax=Herbaspirillum seropedicae (strain SmR1) TaxID=757424 RepID=D8IUZ1_HERSS|nr:hypothetical protein [Herbaspirillum seropedicae]ADJ61710.1 conserved hypothetical protein [Herbaspirillum seropedicae SmR1]AKN63918.1 hypothetical protein ACP92_00915 [Herbaspirillum seropedicae]NQE29290.1 hypothetical protein [Herbaspirillum seropedicae]UMU19826.1 hypothetical protein G5B88_00920 [Herbaspirillum seropedicae]
MANKTLGTRQKLSYRIEPSQSKPRNPVALAAQQRAGGAGPHRKSEATQRQQGRSALLKKLIDGDEEK